MKKETLKLLVFWIGVALMAIPILYIFVDNCFWVVGPPRFLSEMSNPNYREGLHFGYSFGDFADYVSDDSCVPLIILFLIGSAVVSFSLLYYNKGSDKVVVKNMSLFACVLGGLVWLFLIAIIFFNEFWWLSWVLLALSGTSLLACGLKNMVE